MRKLVVIIGCLLGAFFWVRSASLKAAVEAVEIREDEIYFFTQATCPHCQAASLYLKGKYPDLDIKEREISNPTYQLEFWACGKKFGLSKWRMGTPLFCMGSHYIMGWSDESIKEFEQYLKEFQK